MPSIESLTDRLMLCAPLRTLIVTQKFGEDLICIDLATRTSAVPRLRDSCPPGYESLYRSSGMIGHNGIDFRTDYGEAVYAATSGIVSETVTEAERGPA